MDSQESIKKIEFRIIFLVAMLLIVCVSFASSYSNFVVNSNDHRAVEMHVSSLNYDMKINDKITDTVSAKVGLTYLTINITSNNEINTKYKLEHNNENNIMVYSLNNNEKGVIDASSSKEIKLLISNNSPQTQKLTFLVQGGYTFNSLDNITIKEGYNEINNTLSIGENVTYIPNNSVSTYKVSKDISGYTSDQTINRLSTSWRILSINEDGSILLISTKALGINSRNDKLSFKGARGYNNIAKSLNDICNSLYGSFDAVARNLKIEDIESLLEIEPLEKNITYKTNTYIPRILQTSKERSEEESYISENDTDILDVLSLKVNYYEKELEENNKYYDFFFNKSYFLSSRYINSFDSYALYGVSTVEENKINGKLLYSSINNEFTASSYIFPVVKVQTLYNDNGTLKIKN